ncbi:MAG: carboxymuconolactone decarboxylase family protein [Candidatus Izemoplasma sp.]|nr:carboxymuconolactone decarboxylase family protein [Candidatus Izemoplasma sp.]
MKKSRVFKIKEQIKNIYNATKAFVLLKRSKRTRLMTKPLKERIMLAVTSVNGCNMCSYVHTKIALKSGMSSKQIQELLSGDDTKVPEEEAVAVAFATHFADSKESPEKEVIDRIIKEYGNQKATLIFAACQMITMTNGMGIALDDSYHRIKLKGNKESNIVIELLNPLLTMPLFIPLVIYHFIGSLLPGKISFKEIEVH